MYVPAQTNINICDCLSKNQHSYTFGFGHSLDYQEKHDFEFAEIIEYDLLFIFLTTAVPFLTDFMNNYMNKRAHKTHPSHNTTNKL